MSRVVTVLQPDAHVPLDRFGPWLADAGVDVVTVPLFSGAEVPDAASCGSGLVLLGGSKDAHDEASYPWLPAVRTLLTDAVAAGLPVFGICLGHQILADALGGEVSVADPRGGEDGAVAITWLPAASGDALVGAAAALGEAVVPESHHDAVVRLPEGAVELARSERYANQAFRLGSAVGVQFHPEASPDLMAAWAVEDELDPEPMRAQMATVDAAVTSVGRALARGFAGVLG